MKQKIFTLEDMNITVKLHLSPDDYPKTLRPNEADFFIHINSNDEDFTEDTINSLDDAAGLIKSKVDKNPEAQQQYKFKIKKYGVYIRDEAKDNIELDFLYDVILSLVDEVQAYLNNDVSQEEEQLPEQDNKNEIDLEDDYTKNHQNQEINEEKDKIKQQLTFPDEEEKINTKPEDLKRKSMRISQVSLSDTQSEEDGENVLNLLLSETNKDKK